MHGPADKFAQDQKIKQRLEHIKYPIMVMSGKGGVGKSTVSVNLAFALAQQGHSVGIMDVDVHGPNIPLMLGLEENHFEALSAEEMAPVTAALNVKVASLALAGYDPDEAIIWRGPVKIAMVRQFLSDIIWGDLDYLIIDTPPGTGDEVLTVAQQIPGLAGAVVVSTPQNVSILDSRKSVSFARKLNVPLLGLVENMSGFVCPHCNTVSKIFKSDGGKELCASMDVPFLAEIPIEPGIVEAGDSGTPFILSKPESITVQAFQKLAISVQEHIKEFETSGFYKKPEIDPDFHPER